MANGLQGLTKHLALCLSGGRSGKNRPRYSTTIHLYVCQQVNVEILVISYLRVTFEGTYRHIVQRCLDKWLIIMFGLYILL